MKQVLSQKLFLAVLPAVVMLWGGNSRVIADEFAPLSPGDPIYSHLAVVASDGAPVAGGTKRNPSTNTALTRFEAALQTARAYLTLVEADKANRPSPLSRDALLALKELAPRLRSELSQLDVNPDAVVALTVKLSSRGFGSGKAIIASAPPLAPVRSGFGNLAQNRAPGAVSLLQNSAGSAALVHKTGASVLEVPLSRRLRIGTALLALEREQSDLFGDRPGLTSSSRNLGPATRPATAAGASLAYDFNEWGTVRAGTSTLRMGLEPSYASSVLAAPLFQGARRASASGGGLDVALGNLRLSTDVERLGLSNGSRGTRVGGGIGLTAWQNRLSLSANMSRLLPEDSAALASTATEMNIGLDVTQRLSLSLLYQGLFTEQSLKSNSRVAGGITLNF